MKPTCRHFPESNSKVERRVKYFYCAGSWTGELEKWEGTTTWYSSILLPISILVLPGIGRKRGKQQVHPCPCSVSIGTGQSAGHSHSFSPLIFDHPVEKPWFLLKTQGHWSCDSKTSWPHLAISSPSLSRKHYTWALCSQTCAPTGWVDNTGGSCPLPSPSSRPTLWQRRYSPWVPIFHMMVLEQLKKQMTYWNSSVLETLWPLGDSTLSCPSVSSSVWWSPIWITPRWPPKVWLLATKSKNITTIVLHKANT